MQPYIIFLCLMQCLLFYSSCNLRHCSDSILQHLWQQWLTTALTICLLLQNHSRRQPCDTQELAINHTVNLIPQITNIIIQMGLTHILLTLHFSLKKICLASLNHTICENPFRGNPIPSMMLLRGQSYTAGDFPHILLECYS